MHTAGPWKTNDALEKSGSIPITQDPNGKVIAYISKSKLPMEANAKLIAAAPELLDALEMIISELGNQDSELIENAKKAISKARS